MFSPSSLKCKRHRLHFKELGLYFISYRRRTVKDFLSNRQKKLRTSSRLEPAVLHITTDTLMTLLYRATEVVTLELSLLGLYILIVGKSSLIFARVIIETLIQFVDSRRFQTSFFFLNNKNSISLLRADVPQSYFLIRVVRNCVLIGFNG